MQIVTMSPQENLINSLQGQSFLIPNFEELMDHWPRSINSEMSSIVPEVEKRISR